MRTAATRSAARTMTVFRNDMRTSRRGGGRHGRSIRSRHDRNTGAGHASAIDEARHARVVLWRALAAGGRAGKIRKPMEEPRQDDDARAAGPADRLDSWKEIAAYLRRSPRTVQRWERQEGLPVHRLVHDK